MAFCVSPSVIFLSSSCQEILSFVSIIYIHNSSWDCHSLNTWHDGFWKKLTELFYYNPSHTAASEQARRLIKAFFSCSYMWKCQNCFLSVFCLSIKILPSHVPPVTSKITTTVRCRSFVRKYIRVASLFTLTHTNPVSCWPNVSNHCRSKGRGFESSKPTDSFKALLL